MEVLIITFAVIFTASVLVFVGVSINLVLHIHRSRKPSSTQVTVITASFMVMLACLYISAVVAFVSGMCAVAFHFTYLHHLL